MNLLPFTLWLLCFPVVCLYCDDVLFKWYGKPDEFLMFWVVLIEFVVWLSVANVLWGEAKGTDE